jgi:hypothetical protein
VAVVYIKVFYYLDKQGRSRNNENVFNLVNRGISFVNEISNPTQPETTWRRTGLSEPKRDGLYSSAGRDYDNDDERGSLRQ